jgi:hypothetical protein
LPKEHLGKTVYATSRRKNRELESQVKLLGRKLAVYEEKKRIS